MPSVIQNMSYFIARDCPFNHLRDKLNEYLYSPIYSKDKFGFSVEKFMFVCE